MQRRTRLLTAVSTAIAVLGAGLGLAAKPAPPPPGTTYFLDRAGTDAPDVIAMNGDGSGKSLALPTGTITNGEPSALTYGERLWLVREEELAAYRREADGSVSYLQVTQVMQPDPNPGIRWLTAPRWANSGLDEFLSFQALVVDEAGHYWSCIYRLNLSGNDVAAALDAGGAGWAPVGPDDPRLELVHCIPYSAAIPPDTVEDDPDGQAGLQIVSHDWSPDGRQLAYAVNEYIASEGTSTDGLLVRNLATAAEQVVLGGEPGNSTFNPRWVSRRQRHRRPRLALGNGPLDRRSGRDECHGGRSGSKQRPAGSRVLVARQPVPGLRTGGPKAVLHDAQYDLLRVQSDGSGAKVLTSDLDPLTAKSLLGWQ